MEIVDVIAFIDWDTASRFPHGKPNRATQSGALTIIQELQQLLARFLSRYPSTQNKPCRVTLRLYHGWHKGYTETSDRSALSKLRKASLAGRDNDSLARTIKSVLFSNDIEFGDELLCGGERGTLRGTLREQGSDEELAQKMVDTALVADLLHLAKTRPMAVAIVVSDDDDMLPGVFTAIEWTAKAHVIRVKRERESKLTNTDGIVWHAREPAL